MKIKLVGTNECEIRVEPIKIGDYGVFFISGMERSPEDEYILCQEIESQIKRHVTNVGHTYIHQKHVYETDDGVQHERLYDALEHLFDEDGGLLPRYSYTYERPGNKGVRTVGHAYDFRDLVEEAWENPWNFTVTGTPLNDRQKKFLDRVISESPRLQIGKYV